MAFESLSDKLTEAFKRLRGKGRLTEADVKEAMREVKLALLEADVNFKVVKDFVRKVTERATGADVLESLSPAQMVIKIVNEELIRLMGSENQRISISPKPPTVVMLVGLQGAGKTTNGAKLAGLFKKQGKRPLLVACDIYRPAAIKQLEVVGGQLGIPVFQMGQENPVKIAKAAIRHAQQHGNDMVFLDTAGRLHIDEALMTELQNIKAAVNPAEILLVIDAMIGQDAVKTAKAFANEEAELEKFDVSNDSFKTSKRAFHRAMGRFNAVMEFFLCILSVAVISVGGFLIMQGRMDLVDLFTFSLYISTFTSPVRKLVNFAEMFANGFAGLGRFVELMRTEPKLRDAPDAKALGHVRGAIDVEDVSFSYEENQEVLEHVTLHVRPGETVAVVGPSGGGKTTLCNLIPRFYEVTGGRILIDGQDIQHVTLKSLREDIGIVQQDVYLFSGSVADNIAYGKPGATREEIIEAARLAGAERFISALKDGFDTYVGERGVKLSGGQKQRIAIARVFLKNPPILILDEATSALDNESEILVGQSLEKLAHGRTTLTIAHRLTTIKDYDRILVLGAEGIEESGTHDELLAKKGVYYRLWNQLPGEDTL